MVENFQFKLEIVNIIIEKYIEMKNNKKKVLTVDAQHSQKESNHPEVHGVRSA